MGYTQGVVRFAQFAVLTFVTFAAAADPTAEVRCQEIAFSLSVENKDIDAFRSFLDGDARFVGHAVTSGPEAITNAWSVFFADDGPAIKWRPQFVEVLQDATLALTRGPYRMISKDPEGKLVENWGTFNSIWRKNPDGEWRVVFDAGNSAAEPPDEESQALLDAEDDC